MNGLQQLLQSKGMKRFLVVVLLLVFIYTFRGMMNLLLIFYILTYLMNQLHKFLTRKMKIKTKAGNLTTLILQYVIFIALIGFGIYKLIPSVITELKPLVDQVVKFYDKPLPVVENQFLQDILASVQSINFSDYVNKGMTFMLSLLQKVSAVGMNIIMALILSLFFLLEKDRIKQFIDKFRTSKLAYFYEELCYFGNKFTHSFGKVLEVQVTISFLNCIMSIFFLWLMGFPNLIALSLMIFVLGLIPVAGVFISLIPLCAIGFSIGGFKVILYVLIMIAALHSFETYLMNPKLMSAKTKLPIFFTFIVLLVSEHFIGVWGLILGIPLFIFLLDLLEVNFADNSLEKVKGAH
ncbi:AI-2E family transporter [Paenibacillus marinisediminis]